eukprot:GFYU01009256.1.p1 GENE.GFYU01009256.1~~GFYU01009256.1.p1  ORF type:complete len:299 (+),score=-16.39 GFYU01009256.1:65-898(+)
MVATLRVCGCVDTAQLTTELSLAQSWSQDTHANAVAGRSHDGKAGLWRWLRGTGGSVPVVDQNPKPDPEEARLCKSALRRYLEERLQELCEHTYWKTDDTRAADHDFYVVCHNAENRVDPCLHAKTSLDPCQDLRFQSQCRTLRKQIPPKPVVQPSKPVPVDHPEWFLKDVNMDCDKRVIKYFLSRWDKTPTKKPLDCSRHLPEHVKIVEDKVRQKKKECDKFSSFSFFDQEGTLMERMVKICRFDVSLDRNEVDSLWYEWSDFRSHPYKSHGAKLP